VRKLHRRIGLPISILLSIVVISGVILHRIDSFPGKTAAQSNGIFGEITRIAQSPFNAHMVYVASTVGVFRSLDSGTSFSRVQLRRPSDDVVGIQFLAPNDVYIADRSGFLSHSRGGKIWQEISLPPSVEMLLSFSVGPKSNQITIFDGKIIHRSTNAGQSWVKLFQQQITQRSKIRQFVHDLHTGSGIFNGLAIVYDLVSLGFVTLAVTGWLLFFRTRKKKR